jgi:hypothetical protein
MLNSNMQLTDPAVEIAAIIDAQIMTTFHAILADGEDGGMRLASVIDHGQIRAMVEQGDYFHETGDCGAAYMLHFLGLLAVIDQAGLEVVATPSPHLRPKAENRVETEETAHA